jgi:hypothetical protein
MAVEVVERVALSLSFSEEDGDIEVRVMIVEARLDMGENKTTKELEKNPPIAPKILLPLDNVGEFEEELGNAVKPNALKYSGGKSLEYI